MLCRIANRVFDFQNFTPGNLWDSWQWKLDPYKIAGSAENAVVIRRRAEHPYAEDAVLKYAERRGFFDHCFYEAENGDLLLRVIRRKSGEVCFEAVLEADRRSICITIDRTETNGHMALEFVSHLIHILQLRDNILTFHGVLMEYRGQGIILSAPSGTGKTTHARLWRDLKNALIINGDCAVCGLENGRWVGYGTPWSGTSGEQINRKVPIKAMVVLGRGEENQVRPLTGLEAFGPMWAHVRCPNWDRELAGKALELANSFLSDVPIYRLRCRPDADSVEVLHGALWKDF